jgi:hypothetical protein
MKGYRKMWVDRILAERQIENFLAKKSLREF